MTGDDLYDERDLLCMWEVFPTIHVPVVDGELQSPFVERKPISELPLCVPDPPPPPPRNGGDDRPRRDRPPLACITNWQVNPWSVCVSGFQERSVLDLNNCNNEVNKPASVQPCAGGDDPIPEGCVPQWDCLPWTKCRTDGTQERACDDRNKCVDATGRPPLQQSCVYESKALFIFIIFAVIAALLVGTSWFARRKAWWLSLVGSILLIL